MDEARAALTSSSGTRWGSNCNSTLPVIPRSKPSTSYRGRRSSRSRFPTRQGKGQHRRAATTPSKDRPSALPVRPPPAGQSRAAAPRPSPLRAPLRPLRPAQPGAAQPGPSPLTRPAPHGAARLPAASRPGSAQRGPAPRRLPARLPAACRPGSPPPPGPAPRRLPARLPAASRPGSPPPAGPAPRRLPAACRRFRPHPPRPRLRKLLSCFQI
ncbi:basic proline-rich protein-like [Zonotrichia leucophrys gambelii]|uniref:basic proline-rich protein-like n=1 Tax=Zonotrichia leucophrys gambelii TaxID=257770 RepID=UPI003140625D